MSAVSTKSKNRHGTNKMTSLAVLMCVNKKNSDLGDAISSILQQSMENFTFYIIANNCDDELWNYLNEFSDERIKLHRTNIGQLTFNLNYGINLIHADYVVRMDSDDISHSSRLDNTLKLIIDNDFPDMVAGSANIIDENGKIIGEKIIQNKDGQHTLWYKSPFIHPAVAIKRSTLISLGGYLGGFNSEDYDLWLRMSRLPDIRVIKTKDIFIDYRISPEQSRGSSLAYSEVAGHLLREALYMNSLKFFTGALIAILKRYFRATK